MYENQIRKYRDLFSETFLLFFKNNNFQIHPPLPLRITFDKTLSFSNSTICIFKYYELHNKKCDDYVTVQRGLRTNTYKTLLNNDEKLL